MTHSPSSPAKSGTTRQSESETIHNGADEATPTEGPQQPSSACATTVSNAPKPKETGGREGLDPTRYGDWEKAGRCVDF